MQQVASDFDASKACLAHPITLSSVAKFQTVSCTDGFTYYQFTIHKVTTGFCVNSLLRALQLQSLDQVRECASSFNTIVTPIFQNLQ